ncbi:ArsR family transcriptional regulator [Limosilactobacillus reuteri]|uniref:ArsR/SmtB family transcription factor n=1 Tax=Limosilactobacillus reuteri TaxID=1598 RepID=UPI001093C4A4|nr:ArsR family transcriptional regulator [Limosilactobacillus reuteri]MRI03599.1 helix-turn-helix domain-containing protein [Limosilactobacillus reuteri]TGY47928.1 ArsR family transcriptional regulator [Limosilactobacillus reuteri]
METMISVDYLDVYKALASPVRLRLIKLLSKKQLSIMELASKVGLSSTIVSKHLDKLADVHIIEFHRVGHHKVAKLRVDQINIHFPKTIYEKYKIHKTEVPVGQFTNFSVKPSCGLAGSTGYIGKVDNPSYFADPHRMEAGMIWWNDGHIEYQLPNHLQKTDELKMIDIVAELGSEFPFSNNNWPSDITISLNGTELGFWTSPGDFSDVRGKYTPSWVPNNVNQYGLQKTFRITDHGTYLDGQPWSDISLGDLKYDPDRFILRFEVKKTATHKGGCTIYGHNFGNFRESVQMKLFYE